MLNRETIRLPNGRAWQVFRGGTGPDLVWLHGVRGVDAGDPLLAQLAERFHVIAPVAPGFADLDELADIDDVRDLALAYDDLLRQLRPKSPVLVGHSLGGMMAAELAAHFPDSVSRLTLVTPLGMWNDEYKIADIFGVPAAEMDQLLWADAAGRDAYNARLAAAAPTDEAEQLVGAARRLAAVAKFLWPIPDKGLRRRLPRIAVPTLLIFGEKDAVVPPAYARDFGEGVRQSRTALVAGAGHMAPYEKCSEVAGLIAKFVG